jgi:hypothetical protein
MAYNNYGCLLRRLDKHSEAKEMFIKALSIDAKFVMAQRNLDRANQRERDIQNGVDPSERDRRSRNHQRSGNKHYASGKSNNAGRTNTNDGQEKTRHFNRVSSKNKLQVDADDSEDKNACLVM